MASDRFQMINTLFQLFNCFDFRWTVDFLFFFINIAVGFRLLVIHRRSQRDIFLRCPCIHPSALLSVRSQISVLICHIRIILCTNDMYHVLSISYKFRQNRPLSTWVMALVLVKAFIMQNLYQLFCMMIFTFHQSYYILQLLTIDHNSSVHVT